MADNRRVDFNALRRRADFRAILAHYGLSPVGKGDQVKVQCPFHPDEEPSCSVNLGKRVYHCFACQAAGNVLEFVHRMENRNGEAVTLRRAGILLAEVCGIELPGGNGAQRPKEARTAPRRVEAPKHRPPSQLLVQSARSVRGRQLGQARSRSGTSPWVLPSPL